MSKELDAFERIFDHRAEDGDFSLVRGALERLYRQDLLFKNLTNTTMIHKIPLSEILNNGSDRASQEERYKFFEHIYYTYAETLEQGMMWKKKYLDISDVLRTLKLAHDVLQRDFIKLATAIDIIIKKGLDSNELIMIRSPKEYTYKDYKETIKELQGPAFKEYKKYLKTKKEFNFLREVFVPKEEK